MEMRAAVLHYEEKRNDLGSETFCLSHSVFLSKAFPVDKEAVLSYDKLRKNAVINGKFWDILRGYRRQKYVWNSWICREKTGGAGAS